MIVSFDIGEINLAYVIGNSDEIQCMKHVNVKKKKTQTIIESCEIISEILNSINYSSCSKVIIEQQMINNQRASRIAQHIWTWFHLMKPHLKPEFVRASSKTIRGLNYRQRKKYTVDILTSILESRKDQTNLDYLSSLPKKDDIADAYIQLLEYQGLYGL